MQVWRTWVVSIWWATKLYEEFVIAQKVNTPNIIQGSSAAILLITGGLREVMRADSSYEK